MLENLLDFIEIPGFDDDLQIEVVFTLLIAWFYFKERLTPLELIGIVVTVAGVLMFRLIA